jgi:hypothetical protein
MPPTPPSKEVKQQDVGKDEDKVAEIMEVEEVIME